MKYESKFKELEDIRFLENNSKFLVFNIFNDNKCNNLGDN